MQGLDPNVGCKAAGIWDRQGRTALIEAAIMGNDEVVARLISDPRSDLEVRDLHQGWNAKEWAQHFGNQNVVDVLSSARR